jgi:hypothetical protein
MLSIINTYSCGIKISGTIFLSFQQMTESTSKAPTVIMTDTKSSF